MKLFFTSLALMLLTGCTQQANLATPITSHVMKKTLSNDPLAHQINIAISENPDINRSTSIRVIAQGHQVVLLGQSPQPELSNDAEQIAAALPSTEQVYNYITIKNPLSSETRTKDLLLNTQIQQALRGQNLLYSGQIVTIEDQVAYFVGPDVFENYEPIEQAILNIHPSITIIPISLS